MSRRGYKHSGNRAFQCRRSTVLLPFGRDSYLSEIVDREDGRQVELGGCTDRVVFDLHRPDPAVTLVYSGMGAPAVANALEMIAANGGRDVVLFGACGGVARELGIGDLVIATGAVRGEGTSSYYAPSGFPALLDPDLSNRLWRQAESVSSNRAHRGVVFTTDASYRQGPEVYEEYGSMVLAVECEAAAAAVVGLCLDLRVGCLLFCTDNVNAENPTDRSYASLEDPRVANGFRAGLEAVLAALA